MEDENNAAQAEKYKNLGNDEFKKKNFREAIELYTKAIGKHIIWLNLILYFCLDAKPDEPAYYTNRAIANLKIDNFTDAMSDCKAALRIDEKFAKAYNRMSKCHISLGNLTEASIAL